jgi:hypothetical protein
MKSFKNYLEENKTGTFDTEEEATQYAHSKYKGDDLEIFELKDGSFAVNSEMNSAGRDAIKKSGGVLVSIVISKKDIKAVK